MTCLCEIASLYTSTVRLAAPPVESLEDALPGQGAVFSSFSRVIQQLPYRRGERGRIGGRDKYPASPTTSGSAPAVVETTGEPQDMASAAGNPNPSYVDGTASRVAVRYNLTSSEVSTWSQKLTQLVTPSLSISFSVSPSPNVRPTTTSLRSHFFLNSASARNKKRSPLTAVSRLITINMVSSSLFTPSRRTEYLRVDTVVDDPHPVVGDTEYLVYMMLGHLRNRDDIGQLPGNLYLHAGKGKPAPVAQFVLERLCRL